MQHVKSPINAPRQWPPRQLLLCIHFLKPHLPKTCDRHRTHCAVNWDHWVDGVFMMKKKFLWFWSPTSILLLPARNTKTSGYAMRHCICCYMHTFPIWRIHLSSLVRPSTVSSMPRLVHALLQMSSVSIGWNSALNAHTQIRGVRSKMCSGCHEYHSKNQPAPERLHKTWQKHWKPWSSINRSRGRSISYRVEMAVRWK